MIWLADRVSTFLQKNKMYEVLGLFVLLIVGIMLLSEGGELAHFEFFGNPIHAMSKTTFYFVIGVLIFTDIVQSRYQRKILAARLAMEKKAKDEERSGNFANANEIKHHDIPELKEQLSALEENDNDRGGGKGDVRKKEKSKKKGKCC